MSDEEPELVDVEDWFDEGVDQGKLIAYEVVKEIIRSHMDEAKDINVPSNDDWIPVEERLPEEKMEVLCCFENGTVQSLWQNWKNDGLGDYFDDDLIPTEVIAWQPLPEPYKGGDDRA